MFTYVIVSPSVTKIYPDPTQIQYTVNLGNTVTFECEATGIPPPTITWYRNNTELTNITNPRLVFSQNDTVIRDDQDMIFIVNRTLSLLMSEDGDSGIYECIASNDATPGEVSMEFELTVQSNLL